MKRVDLKKKLLKKREKTIVAAKYAHMWIDLVIGGNYHIFNNNWQGIFSAGKKVNLIKLSNPKDVPKIKKRRTSSLDEMGEF